MSSKLHYWADIIDACMIAGWDTGKFNLSRDMLDYGMEGMTVSRWALLAILTIN